MFEKAKVWMHDLCRPDNGKFILLAVVDIEPITQSQIAVIDLISTALQTSLH